MEYRENVYRKVKEYEKIKDKIDPVILKKYHENFAVQYAHNSTAIEGNTLTLRETAVILNDKLTPAVKDLREIYEVVNHNKAYDYVQECIANDLDLDENIIKDIHSILMENIMPGGIYRNVPVYISGAQHEPPLPNEMYFQIKGFYEDLKNISYSSIEKAAWTHAEFVRIHPFIDGNGRTSRLIMNYQLMKEGMVPISIPKEKRLEYYEVLEEYALNKNITPFADMIAKLEERELDRYIAMVPDREIGRQDKKINEKEKRNKKQRVR